MRDQAGFAKAIDKLFDDFSQELSTLRVYLKGANVVVTADAHVMGGRLFDPKQVMCPYEQLPDFITEKIAVLKAAGKGVPITDVGEWRTVSAVYEDNMFYVKATPKQWNEYARKMRFI